jgi:hypothetical protein
MNIFFLLKGELNTFNDESTEMEIVLPKHKIIFFSTKIFSGKISSYRISKKFTEISLSSLIMFKGSFIRIYGT